MSGIDDYAVPIPSGMTAVTSNVPLNPARKARLLAELRCLAQARNQAAVASRTYVVGGHQREVGE